MGALGRGQALRLGAVAILVAIAPGCAREPQEVREVRLAAERYMTALARKNFEEIRERATCLVAVQSIQGGNVLRIDPPRFVLLSSLDSLATTSAASHRKADSLWISGVGGDREALLEASRRAGRLHITYRNASRAVAASSPEAVHGSSIRLETRAVRTRVRYAGPLVGPKPVDREIVVRMIRAPLGKWIVFSFYTAEDDPRPDGV